jgi:hypothetical protein
MKRFSIAVAGLLLFGAAGCADLNVANIDRPDTRQVLADPADLESLIQQSFTTWWDDQTWATDMALSAAGMTHQTIAANWGMIDFSWIPRRPLVNTPSWSFREGIESAWFGSYSAARSATDGITLITGTPPVRIGVGGADTQRALAFAWFVHGLSHATIAITYDQGFILVPGVSEFPELQPASAVMTAALASFAEAIRIAEANQFTIPAEWMGNVSMTNAQFANLIRGYRARYRAHMARTPAERQAVDWNAVRADASAVTTSFIPVMDRNPWWHYSLIYRTFATWASLPYHTYGLADQSGNFQAWLAQDPASAQPFRIATPDLRFPQGATDAEQIANPGRYYARTTGTVGVQPGRGMWRWSWYRDTRFDAFMAGPPAYTGPTPELTVREMRLLIAEGAIYQGNRAEAAGIINETRTQHGLNATNADGLNTSCVPRLPNGQCGGLLEMLKWEKRNEVRMMQGFAGGYFDARGWGDLVQGTVLELPIPATELDVLGLPYYTFGGIGGRGAAPVGTYGY